MHFYFFASFFIIDNQYLPLTPEAATRGVLRNFTKFTGKGLCQSLFFKKATMAQVFSFEFCDISKNTFFTEHLWTTASVTLHISRYCCARTRNFSKTILTKTYASFIFHTQININSKNCDIAVIPIFSQFTSMYMPKN